MGFKPEISFFEKSKAVHNLEPMFTRIRNINLKYEVRVYGMWEQNEGRNDTVCIRVVVMFQSLLTLYIGPKFCTAFASTGNMFLTMYVD